ncbi:hypothetical protein IscW_ISCW021067, partial [Ixodes scapularis]
ASPSSKPVKPKKKQNKTKPTTRSFLGTKPSAVNKRRRPIITELIPHAEHFQAQIRRRPTWCLAELVRRGTDNYDNPRRRQAGRRASEQAGTQSMAGPRSRLPARSRRRPISCAPRRRTMNCPSLPTKKEPRP